MPQVLDAIKLGKDATEVTDCCKPLTKKVELLQVILKLAALVQSAPKEEKVVSEKLDENVALTANADDDANDDANADVPLKLKEAEEIEAQEVATKKVAEDRGATVVIVDSYCCPKHCCGQEALVKAIISVCCQVWL
jgi:hypothetical protein